MSIQKGARPVLCLIGLLCFAQSASAQVVINEVELAPTKDRFIELYNKGNTDVDLTGWYLQRKTASGTSFGSLVPSTQLNGRMVTANGYFLIARTQVAGANIVSDGMTLTESNTIRLRDAKGKDIDQIGWGSVADGKSYQRTSSGGWIVGDPTPGNGNDARTTFAPPPPLVTAPALQVSQNAQSVQTPSVTPPPPPLRITTESSRTALAGIPVLFESKMNGILSATPHFDWSFGDGAAGEGASVSHVYYYPGEYIAVLDVVSGDQKISGRTTVHVVAPALFLHMGGDDNHSFVAIENRGSDELDISGWQVKAKGKSFVIPQNTILGTRKTITLASEVTGLAVASDADVELLFANGAKVPFEVERALSKVPEKKVISAESVHSSPTPKLALPIRTQKAFVADAVPSTVIPAVAVSEKTNDSSWSWYVAIALLAVFGVLSVRLVSKKRGDEATNADDFEIL